MLLQIALFHTFLWLVVFCVCVYIYHIFSQSSVNGHLGCFYVFTIANSPAMNIGLHVSF